jgi:hypothetical protein
MSTRGAYYVGRVQGRGQAEVVALRVGRVGASNVGSTGSVGACNMVWLRARGPHNEHTGCSLCGSHVLGHMGPCWRQRAGWGEADNGGGVGDVGAHETEPLHARDPHNEHVGCSLCGSHASGSTGWPWRRWAGRSEAGGDDGVGSIWAHEMALRHAQDSHTVMSIRVSHYVGPMHMGTQGGRGGDGFGGLGRVRQTAAVAMAGTIRWRCVYKAHTTSTLGARFVGLVQLGGVRA